MLRTSHTVKRSVARLAGAWVGASLLSGGAAFAQDSLDERRQRGMRLAAEGRCELALADLDAARESHAADVALALRTGECRLRLQRYAEAVLDLERADTLSPGTSEISLSLAKARFHSGDLAGAQSALDAVPALEGDAEAQLYHGLLALDRSETDAGIAHLERAIALDAGRVDPVASFHLGRALALRDDDERATSTLGRVADGFHGTEWATQAAREMKRIASGEPRQVWLSLTAGFEHDSNVILRGRGLTLPGNISDEEDQRGVWGASLGAELVKTPKLTAGVMASYHGTTHVDLEDFNSQFPSLSVWAESPISEGWLARARYDFGYAWFDGDPFVASNSWQISVFRDGALGGTEIFGRANVDEYFFESGDVTDDGTPCLANELCGPPGLDESDLRDRDGWGASGGVSHTLPLPTRALPVDEAALVGGYRYAHFDADGRDYTYDSHKASLALTAALPYQVALDAGGSFDYKPYRNASSFPDPAAASASAPGAPYVLSTRSRRDRIWEANARVARPVTDAVSVAARWRYTDHDSNTDVFDFDRHVLGVYVTVGLGREL